MYNDNLNHAQSTVSSFLDSIYKYGTCPQCALQLLDTDIREKICFVIYQVDNMYKCIQDVYPVNDPHVTHNIYSQLQKWNNCLGGVIVDQRARWFELVSDQTKDCKNSICCFFAKPAVLWSKNKDCLARNQDNVSELSNMSTCGLLFQFPRQIKQQLSACARDCSIENINMDFTLYRILVHRRKIKK